MSTLLHRGFMIRSFYRALHLEILKLKQIFRSNAYRKSLVDRCIQKMMPDSFEPRSRIFVKGYGCLRFAKNMSKNTG